MLIVLRKKANYINQSLRFTYGKPFVSAGQFIIDIFKKVNSKDFFLSMNHMQDNY